MKRRKILESYQRTENVVEYENEFDANCRGIGMILKDWKKMQRELEVRRRIENIQTTAFLKSIRILRRFLLGREDLDLLSDFSQNHQSKLQWKTREELYYNKTII